MDNQTLIAALKEIAGSRHVTGESNTERYRKGFSPGGGKALADAVSLKRCCSSGNC